MAKEEKETKPKAKPKAKPKFPEALYKTYCASGRWSEDRLLAYMEANDIPFEE